MTATSDLLLQWDRRRPRAQQREFGMSELGGCRRRAGYRLAGTEPTNSGGSVQAVMGTAIHGAIAEVLEEVKEPGDLVEHPVTFAGILGHLDRYEAATATVVDTKTTSSRWLDHLRKNGPGQQHRWQVSAYAAALLAEGYKVRRVRIDYLARDTGEEWLWEEAFDPQNVRDALEWVRVVRETPLEMLPRDYAPDSAFCGGCSFRDTCWEGAIPDRDKRSVLYVENPDAAMWAQKLWDAREAKKAAEKLEAEARGALDAIRPNDDGKEVVDVGWRLPIEFRVTTTKRIDTSAVKAEYAKAGAEPPYREGQPTVVVGFGKPVEKP